MAIFLVYSTSSITSSEKVYAEQGFRLSRPPPGGGATMNHQHLAGAGLHWEPVYHGHGFSWRQFLQEPVYRRRYSVLDRISLLWDGSYHKPAVKSSWAVSYRRRFASISMEHNSIQRKTIFWDGPTVFSAANGYTTIHISVPKPWDIVCTLSNMTHVT